jgi:predicted nuclease of restriction endonuclease-like (RecB) superfamily
VGGALRFSTEKQIKRIEGYAQLLTDLKARIQAARTRVALAANQEVIGLYWDIGKMVVERRQNHKWGDAVSDRLSQDLRRKFHNAGKPQPNKEKVQET